MEPPPCTRDVVCLFGIPDRPAERVAAADVVVVAGGNTANMLALWRLHHIDEALASAWSRGAALGGVSAGGNCWFEACVTDSFSVELDGLEDGLGLLAGSFCPHYDGEERRRPVYTRLVAEGFPAGIACDDGAAAVYRGTELLEIVADRPGALGYQGLGRRRRARRRPPPAAVRKVSVISSASGSGKTTVARELARRLGVPFVELDALVHGPNWTETSDDELRRLLEPVLAGDGWVIDGGYWGKIGDLVLASADLVIWIDLPLHVWLPRLVRRTARRLGSREEIWNGNRETFRGAVMGPRRADPLRDPGPLPAPSPLSGTAVRVPGRAALHPGGGGQVSQRRRRDLNSATQAAARRPIQIGVRIT